MKRQLHVDYNKILHGSGLVGLIFFGGLYVALLVDLRRVMRPLRFSSLARTSRVAFIALCVTSLVLSIGSDMEYVGSRTILFIYLGAFIGVAVPVHLPQAAGTHRYQRGGNRCRNREVSAIGNVHRTALGLARRGSRSKREGEGVRRHAFSTDRFAICGEIAGLLALEDVEIA